MNKRTILAEVNVGRTGNHIERALTIVKTGSIAQEVVQTGSSLDGLSPNQENAAIAGFAVGTPILIYGLYRVLTGSVLIGVVTALMSGPVGGAVAVGTGYMLRKMEKVKLDTKVDPKSVVTP